MVVIDLGSFDAFVFDLDGVITRTAAVHARAWKQLFDEWPRTAAAGIMMQAMPAAECLRCWRAPRRP